MNTKQLTLIHADGSQQTWRAPPGGRISETQMKGKDCVSITNVIGTEVNTVCFLTGKSSAPAAPVPGPTTGDCGCNGS